MLHDHTVCAEISVDKQLDYLNEGPMIDVGTLLRWAADTANIKCKHLTAGDDLAIRGVLARQNLPARSTMVSVPRKLALTVVTGHSTPMPKLVPQKLWKSFDT